MGDITISQDVLKQMIDQAVESLIENAVQHMAQDPVWLERVERMINQAVVQRTVATLGSMDIASVIKQRVDENDRQFRDEVRKHFASTGILDQASACQLTVMDETVVVENQFIAKDIEAVNSVTVKDLVVKGSINTDNRSWQNLADNISERTLNKLTAEWKEQLITEVEQHIQRNGIDFDTITLGGQPLINGNALSGSVTQSNLQQLGTLKELSVRGEAHIYETLNVLNHRVGVNTTQPEMALSVWDEEVSVVIGKHKAKQAYVGTNRENGLSIGVNGVPQIEINTAGVTTVKQLQVGLHRIMFDTQVPGWAGTKGDIVFNSAPTNSVFAWVCLGAHKWKTLRAVE